MKNIFSFLVFLLPILNVNGQSETIRVHDKVDMTWYGAYDEFGSFPDGSTEYEEILLHYTMGCASGGCSDWDYTTKIELRIPTGMMDSTVSILDTISAEPYVVDTTWNVFEVMESFELGRVITPYGGYMATNQHGFSNAWEHTHTFDVTDFAPLLKDSVMVRAFYDGWSSGFAATLDFEFKEGKAPRKVHSIQNIYSGGSNYNSQSQIEQDYLYAKSVNIPNDVKSAKMRIIPSGHGFDNNVNCAEFCQRRYYLNVNDEEMANVLMWDDQCGANPIYPQGGTWLYNRANWCPGMPAKVYDHEITSALNMGEDNAIDMDIQNINWVGNQAPYYILSAQLITYENDLPETDLAITEIIAPNNHEDHSRYNPICSNPIIEITNYGEETITSCIVKYGVNTNIYEPSSCYYKWEGSLETNETEKITLPRFDWLDVNLENPVFTAEILEINEYFDDIRNNNVMESAFLAPTKLSSIVKLKLRTNNSPNETDLFLYDENGDVFHEQTSFEANTIHDYEWFLPEGCYKLMVLDNTASGGDGLSWWANSEGSGYVRLYDSQDNLIENFNPDFGSFIEYNFTVGYTMGLRAEPNLSCNDITNPDLIDPLTEVDPVSDIEDIDDSEVSLFPNPASDFINLSADRFVGGTLTIFDMKGSQVHNQIITERNKIDINLSNGLYYIKLQKDELVKLLPLTVIK